MRKDLVESLTLICGNLFEKTYSVDEEIVDGKRIISIKGEFWCGANEPFLASDHSSISLYSTEKKLTDRLKQEVSVVKDVLQTCIGTWIAQIMFKNSYALRFFNVKSYQEPLKDTDKTITTVSLFANPVSQYFRVYPYQEKLIEMQATKLSDSGTVNCSIIITVMEQNRVPGLFL